MRERGVMRMDNIACAFVTFHDLINFHQTDDAGEECILRWNEEARRRSPSPENSTCFCSIGGKSKELYPTVIAETGLGLDIISIGFSSSLLTPSLPDKPDKPDKLYINPGRVRFFHNRTKKHINLLTSNSQKSAIPQSLQDAQHHDH